MAHGEVDIQRRADDVAPSSGVEADMTLDPSNGNRLPTFAELDREMGRKVLEALAKKPRPVAYGRYLRIMRYFMVPDDTALDVLYNSGHDIRPDALGSIVFPGEPRPLDLVT